MKKIICALLSLVLLCSCSSEKNVRVINRNLSYKAHIFYFDKEYDIFCNVSEQGAEYSVIDGQIKGFKATVNKEGIKVGFGNLEKDTKNKSMSVFSVLYDITEFFDTDEYKTERDGGNYFVDGEMDFGKFRYLLTPAGLPISVRSENGKFSAQFYDIALKKVK